jgi:hypothetical protein
MHSPAPWHVKPLTDTQMVCRIDGKPVALVVAMPQTAQHSIHDARLIAAAPDMLYALEEISHALGDCALTRKARAAIAKATGDQR